MSTDQKTPQTSTVNEDRELDALLNTALPPPASDALKARILDGHARSVGSAGGLSAIVGAFIDRLTNRPFIPAGAMAGLGVLGFAIGLSTASTSMTVAETDALYYADAAVSAAFATSDEDLIWAVD